MKRVATILCEWLRKTRVWLADWLVFLSLRIIGSEVSFKEVHNQALLSEIDSVKLDFAQAKDPAVLLDTAKACFDAAEARRSIVTDKCKTLLTLGSLFLGLVGFLLSKELSYDATWLRALVIVTVALFLHAVVLLLQFFVIGRGMEISLDQTDVGLSTLELQKSLAQAYVRCRQETDNRTDYLAEVYKAARFSFFGAFLAASVLFSLGFLFNTPTSRNQEFIQSLRADPKLIELIRSPRGDQGTRGVKGDAGDNAKNTDAIVRRLLDQLRPKSPLPHHRK